MYKSERLGLEKGIIFQETDQWLNILSSLRIVVQGFVLARLCY